MINKYTYKMDLLDNGGFESIVNTLGAPLLNNPRGFAGDLEVEGYIQSGGDMVVGTILEVDTISSKTGTITITDNTTLNQNQVVKGSLNVGTSITTGNLPGIVGGDITCFAPGIFVGDGSGLTNLPLTDVTNPTYTFQSQVSDFGIWPVNPYWLTGAAPDVISDYPDVPMPYVGIKCEFNGKDPGWYYWKVDAAITLQALWNSASGFLYWDGTKISGHTSYNDFFRLSFYNGVDRSYVRSFFSDFPVGQVTAMTVEIGSTNTSVNPLQANDYYVNCYKIATIGSAPPVLPVPTGLAVSDITQTTATATWNSAGVGLSYTVYLTQGVNVFPYPVGADITTVALTGLAPFTPYTVEVASKYTYRSSAPSAPVPFTTLA